MATRKKIVLLVLALALLGSVTLRDETRLIQELENAPAGRRMDLAAIDGIGMFVVRPERRFVLYFDDFRLE